jgi:predicted nucleotidyltransferase
MKLLKNPEYDFLHTNEHLDKNIILLGLGGSYAYGTNVEGSDIDVRGVATLRPQEILTNQNFEQVEDKATDTVVYSFNKIISLLSNSNPNVIELLGLKKEHYLYLNEVGQELIDNADMFLSKKAAQSFGGYAYAQLRRLDNLSNRTVPQSEQENHILHSILNAKWSFPSKYFDFENDQIMLYTDDAIQEDFDTEIFMDINLHHYPLRDYKGMWAEMNNIVKEYTKIGKRNLTAIEHNKLGKHMMHLVRLYLMGIDILQDGKIITYREKEHDLLMSIRNGDFLKDNIPTKEFRDMVDDLQIRFEKAKEKSDLPDKPNYKKINDFMIKVNKDVILKEQ